MNALIYDSNLQCADSAMSATPSRPLPPFTLDHSTTPSSNRGRASGYNPLKGLEWTAVTECEGMKELVEKREEVFALHRKLDNPTLQRLNIAALNNSERLKSVDSRCLFERYQEFCTMVDIPSLPLSMSTIGLFFFAKCSWKNGHYPSCLTFFRRMIEPGLGIWQAQEGYAVLNDEKVAIALSQFQKERKGISVRPRIASNKSIRTASSQPPLTTLASEMDEDSESGEVSQSSLCSTPLENAYLHAELEETEDEVCRVEGDSVIEQIATPNLPRHGQQFKSSEDLLVACYSALLPVYGTGARNIGSNIPTAPCSRNTIRCARSHNTYTGTPEGICQWSLVAFVNESGSKLVVDLDQSNLYHNHPPHPSILLNPSWRPTIKNVNVRRAFGMTTVPPSKKRKSNQSQSLIVAQVESPSPPPSTASVQLSWKSSLPLSNSMGLTLNLSASQTRTPPGSSNSYQSYSPPFPSSLSYSNPVRSLPTSSFSSSTDSSFLAETISFLKSLDLTLIPLAPVLIKLGFDSLNLLCLFCTFDPSTRRVLANVAQSGSGDGDGGEEVGKLFGLLEEKLAKERKNGFE
ncbi:hypothetical protein JCM3765_001515 [Sporobolomyces pararoseus]